jgi:Mrp family chromosome partitioning ATPase
MKHRITTDSHAHEFRMLRNRIEAEIHAPAVLMVTSATDRDGVSLTAYGIAEALSKTHQRAVLVTAAAPAPAQPDGPAGSPGEPAPSRRGADRDGAGSRTARGIGRGPGQLSILEISPERLVTIARTNVTEMLEELRAEHDYVVIDAGDLPNNSFGQQVSTLADAILVAFLTGRSQVAGDQTMVNTLERTEAKILGVVMNDKATIDLLMHQADPLAPSVPEEPERVERRGFVTQRLELVRERIGKAI